MNIRPSLASPIILFLLLTGMVTSFVSAFLCTRIDNLVHTELYRYGLQFSYEWAGQYWIYTELSMVLQAATLVTWIASFMLLFRSTQPIALLEGQERGSGELNPALVPHTLLSSSVTCAADQNVGAEVAHELEELRRKVWSYKRLPTRLAGYGLTIVGVVVLACSMIFFFSVWAMVGLVLTFWGVFFFFLKPTSFVKAELLDSASISLLENMRRLVAEFGLKGKGVYLPPRYLKDLSGGLVFVSANEETYVPTMDEVGEAEDRVFLGNPNGLCLVPSGVTLVNLFEKELGTSFSKVDLAYLERNLSNVFIEALEIAENFELRISANNVHIRIEGSIYKGLCEEIGRLSGICEIFGCPLCSSIALILARASGKPVVMDGKESLHDGKVVNINYSILEE